MHANKKGAAASEVTRLAESMFNEYSTPESEAIKENLVRDTCRAIIAGSGRLRNAHWKKIVGDVQRYAYDHTATGHFEGVQIRNDSPVTSIDQHRYWFYVAICGDLTLFRDLVPPDGDLLLGYGPFIPSALHSAIATGNEGIVRYILQISGYDFLRGSGYTPGMIVSRLTTAICVVTRQRQFSIAEIIYKFPKEFMQKKRSTQRVPEPPSRQAPCICSAGIFTSIANIQNS